MRKLLSLVLLLALLFLQAHECAAAIAQVSETTSANGNSTTLTSASISTTGASLIVVQCSSDKYTTTGVSNSGTADTWNLLSNYGDSSAGYTLIAYAFSPTTSSSQTFTCTFSNSSSGVENFIYVSAWSGTGTTSAVFQAVRGKNESGAETTTPGSITPVVSGELFITGTSNNSTGYPSPTITVPTSFTGIKSGGYLDDNYANNDAAYYVNSGAGAVNPTWTWANASSSTSSTMAAFCPSPGCPIAASFPGFIR